MFKSDSKKYFFRITELYSGQKVSLAEERTFNGLITEIHFLTEWLHSNLIQIKAKDDETLASTIHILKANTISYPLDLDKQLTFEVIRMSTLPDMK